MELHVPYKEIFKREADFRVSYRYYSFEEGGRWSPVYQGIRNDFWYKNDGNLKGSLYMIWPEFEDTSGNVILCKSEPIALSGTARMWIANSSLIQYHKEYLTLGMSGYFQEGGKRTAECTVIELINLDDNG